MVRASRAVLKISLTLLSCHNSSQEKLMATGNLTIQERLVFGLQGVENCEQKPTQQPRIENAYVSLSQSASVSAMNVRRSKTRARDIDLSLAAVKENKPKSAASRTHQQTLMNRTPSENCQVSGSSKMYFRTTKIFRAFPSVTPAVVGALGTRAPFPKA